MATRNLNILQDFNILYLEDDKNLRLHTKDVLEDFVNNIYAVGCSNESLIENLAIKQVSKGRTKKFNVGDIVRVKLVKISPEMAKRRKALMGRNKSAIHYSPQLYKVIKAVYQPTIFLN